nr:hypothetical protein [Tanacetum cinerariifolium]
MLMLAWMGNRSGPFTPSGIPLRCYFRGVTPALTQKVFANMRRVGKSFSGVETPLFAFMLVQPQPQAEEEVKIPIAPAPPSTTRGCIQTRGTIAAIDADEGITLVDVEIDEEGVSDVSAPELVSAIKPTVFDDEDVTMKIAQTLIKLKAEKAKLLDEQIAQKLHDEEIKKAVAKDKQEKADKKRALELQRQFDEKEENIDRSVVAEQNMSGYKMEFFRRMTYDKVRPIFEREYKKVQTLFKPDKDVQKPKNDKVTDETLLQESFKKLRAAEVSGSEYTQEILSNDPKEMNKENVQNMLEIVPVSEFKVEALQIKYPIIDWEIHTEDMLKGFDREDLVALWNLVKEKFSSAVPSGDKEKALWVELKRRFEPDSDDVLWKLQRYMHAPLTWKLYSDCGVQHVSSTRGHDIFMLTEKDYPLSNVVMILMLSGKLQVEEDNEMARDLVIKIFMKANKPRSRTKDNDVQRHKENAQRNYYCWFDITVVDLTLVLLDKADAAEVWKPTGKIFKTVGLRWVLTGKIFTSGTTKVDSEPTNGSNEDITNQYECKQDLDVSAGFKEFCSDEQAMTFDHNSSELRINDHSNELYSSKLLLKVFPSADTTVPSQQELDFLFGPLYDKFFTTGTSSVNNSSSPTDNSKQQDTPPLMTPRSTTELIIPTITITADDNM